VRAEAEEGLLDLEKTKEVERTKEPKARETMETP
jgi:hypothetical protein